MVHLELFEGPLDLLLYLIRKEEIEITEISLANITQQYLAYLETLQSLELDSAGEFLLIAATLLKIKSRVLLPRQNEDGEEDDPQRDLVAQLLEYRKYKELAQRFRGLADERSQRHDFVPPQPMDSLRSRDEVFSLEFFDLLGALKDVMGLVAEREARHRVKLEEVKLESKLELVRERLGEEGAFLFRDFFAAAPSRLHLVVTFMALLELIRMGEATITQEGSFAEIWIRSTAASAGELAQAASA